MQTWQAHEGTVDSIRYVPDGSRLFTAGSGEVVIWDWPSISALQRFAGNVSNPARPTISPDGRFVAFAGQRGVEVWDWPSSALVRQWPLSDLRAAAFQFSPDGRHLICAGKAGLALAWQWDLESNRLVASLPAPGPGDGGFACAPDGRTVLWGYGFPGHIELADLPTRWRRAGLRHHGPVRSACFCGDGRVVAAVADEEVSIWRGGWKTTESMQAVGVVT